MNGKVTVKDLARIAGVSIGTVDRVLHNRGRVADATAQRVRQAVEDTGFTLNLYASNLAQAKEYRIGVLMPEKEQDTGFWKLPLAGIRESVSDLLPFKVRLLLHEFDRDDETSFLVAADKMMEEEPDGILLAPVLPGVADEFLFTLPEGFPVCCFDTDLPGRSVLGYVGQDSYMSGVVAGKMMRLRIDQTAEPVILQNVAEDFHIEERIRGFLSVFPELTDEQIIRTDELDGYELRQKVEEILLIGAAGIFVTNASVHRVASILKEIGKEDTPLIGYDAIDKNREWLKQGVIDVLLSQRPKQQGYRGLKQLFSHIHGQEQGQIREIMPIDILIQENISYYQDM